MTFSENPQGDLFQAPSFDTRTPLLPHNGKQLTILISCGRRKKKISASAAELYTSQRFKKARAIAEQLGANFYIVSAKHGLINPDKLLPPYDVRPSNMTPDDQAKWGAKVAEPLQRIEGQICLLGTAEYSDPIRNHIRKRPKNEPFLAPLSDIDEHHHGAWYEQALAFSVRVNALTQFYELIECRRHERKVFLLGELSAQTLPPRGVYVFLDGYEKNFLANAPRIVRVGTHAISKGSKALLKSRLRNHLGLKSGSGNHRGSIFRLHVGRALLEQENALESLSSWGKDQDAPPEVRTLETSHEIRVSDYLRKLEVFVLKIDDEPNKYSMRAAVERQLISLCTEGLMTIDCPSDQWLGLSSPMPLIERSGLWNLRDVGKPYDPDGSGSVAEICSRET